MATGTVEIHGYHSGGSDHLGDGSLRIGGVNNLQEMVRVLSTEMPMNSIQVLIIMSPEIIAILIGLLLPAVHKVREAATQLPGSLTFKPPITVGSAAQIPPYIEKSLIALRPYFALDGQVELRSRVAVGNLEDERLTALAELFDVPILIGVGDDAGWQGPVIKGTPDGIIQRV